MTESIAQTPDPPYYAVIFTSIQSGQAIDEYDKTAARMLELAARQPGYLGVEHARGVHGPGITVSYWRDRESIRQWHDVAEHLDAQQKGRDIWYSQFQLRICQVEQSYGFQADNCSEECP